MIERLRSARVFLIVNSRPEFEPTWGARAQVTQLRLNRLNRKESAVLIAAVAGDKTLPDEVLERIVDRTDGVPLFIEELTKTMLESGLLAEADDGYALVGLLRQLPIPNSLQESLLARLDPLGIGEGGRAISVNTWSNLQLRAVCRRFAPRTTRARTGAD